MASDVQKFKIEATPGKEERNTTQNREDIVNMREQPKVTTLIYSPKRKGKNSENNVPERKEKSTKSTLTKSGHASSSSLALSDGETKRKTLQILQPSADGQKLLTGGKSSKSKSKKKVHGSSHSRSRQAKLCVSKINRDTEISSGPETETRSEGTSDTTNSTDEAQALMVQEQAPERYWELLAEERRKALEETLEENMKLYQVIEDLKAENKLLHEKANNTNYFATMYKIAQHNEVEPQQEKFP